MAEVHPEFDDRWLALQQDIVEQRIRHNAVQGACINRVVDYVYTMPEDGRPLMPTEEYIEEAKFRRMASMGKVAAGYDGTLTDLFFEVETDRLNKGALFADQQNWKIDE
jgi:hypothetical protein